MSPAKRLGVSTYAIELFCCIHLGRSVPIFRVVHVLSAARLVQRGVSMWSLEGCVLVWQSWSKKKLQMVDRELVTVHQTGLSNRSILCMAAGSGRRETQGLRPLNMLHCSWVDAQHIIVCMAAGSSRYETIMLLGMLFGARW